MSVELTELTVTESVFNQTEPTDHGAVAVVCSAQVDPEKTTPMFRQYLAVKQDYPGVLLLYRMGDFFETFFEDAVLLAKALEVTLTGREAGQLGRIPMAGIPVKALDNYLQKLMDVGFKVALCDQVQDPAQAKGLVERRVTRVLSKGTVSEQQFLQADQPNYLASVMMDKSGQQWGLAYCDVSTGVFCAATLPFEGLLNELDRLQPAEVLVVGQRQRGEIVDEWVVHGPVELTQAYACTPLKPEAFESKRAQGRVQSWFGPHACERFGLENDSILLASIGAMLGYIEQTVLESARPVFDDIRFYTQSKVLRMNQATRTHLELLQTVRDGRKEGALLSVLDKTQTAMGARLLRAWLSAPSSDLLEIHRRLETVDQLVQTPALRQVVLEGLGAVYDLERLAMKLQNASVMPRDVVALKRSCHALSQLSNQLEAWVEAKDTGVLAPLRSLPEAVTQFAQAAQQAVMDNPALTLSEGGIIQDGFNPELDQLRHIVATQDQWLADYELQERESSGLKTLKVGFNGAFGYYIEISKALAKQAPTHYHRKQTLTNAERFITPELKTFEEQVTQSKGRLHGLEYELFVGLRQTWIPWGAELKALAHAVAIVDVLTSFAQVALENGYCRPIVEDSLELVLHEARHPVIEKRLPLGAFVRNECQLSANPDDHRLPQVMIITGPNMAGKSTYMRQVALAVVMAQMGSFVPASYARIGLVDQLFTRIGAVDDLASGQSTFMVEMTETAYILHRATRHSLVLLDEVGRGTSTYDGVSIAWSVAEHLTRHNGSRTLFATHYHELNTLEQTHPKIQNFKVLVQQNDGSIAFLHTVVPGAAQQSYGIEVAKMAGLPRTVIDKAQKLLTTMHQNEFSAIDTKRKAALLQTAQSEQLSLFGS